MNLLLLQAHVLAVLYFILLRYRRNLSHRPKLRVSALGRAPESSWNRMLRCDEPHRRDEAFMKVCGVSFNGFRYLHRLFASHRHYNDHHRKSIGSWTHLHLSAKVV